MTKIKPTTIYKTLHRATRTVLKKNVKFPIDACNSLSTIQLFLNSSPIVSQFVRNHSTISQMVTVTVRGNATSVTLIESDSDIQTYLLGVINLYIIYTMPCIPWNISPVCCMNVVRGILAVMFEYFIDIYLPFRSTHQICVRGIISVKTASSYSANMCCNVPTVRVQIPERKNKNTTNIQRRLYFYVTVSYDKPFYGVYNSKC